MKIPFGFGKTSIELEIPDQHLIQVLEPAASEQQRDETEIVHTSITNPIGTPELKKIIRPGEKIAIITSDITRPMPSKKVLPILLDELGKIGVADEDIVIVFALGNHRGHTREEQTALVGEEIFACYACVDSNGAMVHLGMTANGTPVDIFDRVADAQRRICLGNIEYHYFAGYSGGAKAIMPGVSTREAIQANHRRMTDVSAAAGKLDSNPVRMDIESVLEYISVDFIVNVVLDEHKRIVGCVAGDVIKAHRQGCRMLDEMYGIKIPQQADIVVVSPGGFPKDIDLYQSQKALDNAKHAVREGGSILWLASASEGLGEKHFEEWMLTHDSPAAMIEHIQNDFVLGGHKAAAIALVMQKADIFLHSDLTADFVRRIHLRVSEDPQQTLDALIAQYGDQAAVIAMPFGGATLPLNQ